MSLDHSRPEGKMGAAHEPVAEASKDKNSITISKNKLIAGVAALSLAIAAGAGVALARGGNDQVAAAPVEVGVDPAFTNEEARSDEPVSPQLTDNEPIVIPEKEANPLGLNNLTQEQISAFNDPLKNLEGSMEDITQEGYEKELLDNFAKALMVWANTNNQATRAVYTDMLFEEHWNPDWPLPAEILFTSDSSPDRIERFMTAKGQLIELGEEEKAGDITFEIGFRPIAKTQEGVPQSWMNNVNMAKTKYVVNMDVEIQDGTRNPNDLENSHESVGADWESRTISDLALHLNKVAYTDPLTNNTKEGLFWQIATSPRM